ncbi:hypothetical protein MBLNU13_g02554t1 [Cladosporium sp. NU13]
MSTQRPPPPPAQGSQQRARRQQIAAACKVCQTRKGKCDGQRPCTWCRDKGKVCEYEVQVGETRMRASKRKYEDLEQEHNALLELIDIAALRPDARDILQQLRNGRKVDDLLGLLKEGDITYQAHLRSSPRTRRMLLGLLIQSTASLDEIILTAPRIAESQLDIAWQSPSPSTQALTGRTLDAAAIILATEGTIDSNAQSIANKPINGHGELSNGRDKLPGWRPNSIYKNVISVPAQPWTKLTTDDALVSHLVTVFLNYNNVYWRYVEEDIFVRSMQSGIPNEFCSTFLVNAICAMACLSSEHSATFLRPDDLMSRGEHFHKEALRLWILERGKASVTNIQALIIMSMEAGFRGKDKLGFSLITIAVQMNHDLPFLSMSSENLVMSDKLKVRVSASWTTHLFEITNSLGLLRMCTPIDKRLSLLPNFPEVEHVWTGEPFISTNCYLRPNALMRERCQLVRLTAEVVNLVFSPTTVHTEPAVQKSAGTLLDLPAPVYELHAHYYCALVTLRSSVPNLQAVSLSSETTDPLTTPTSLETPPLLQAVLDTADLLRKFRQTYGFKSSPAFIFQAAAIVSSILLSHLGSQTKPPMRLANGNPTNLHDDLVSAFNESYRCLLAIGTRVMIGRGVARMVYHSSRAVNTPLPDDTQRLLEVVNEIVWTSTDEQHISSNFPNWATRKSHGMIDLADDMRMERLLKKWEALSLEAS